MTRPVTGRRAASPARGKASTGKKVGTGKKASTDQRVSADKADARKAAGLKANAQKAPARERVLRLFFGLALPEAVTADLARAQSKLSSNWRRVEGNQLHITLAYLPGVPEGRVAALRELGTRLAAEAGPMTLRLRGTGYHPNVGTPRV